MKKTIWDFFYFSKGDRRAVAVLGCVAILGVGSLIVADALKWGSDEALADNEVLRKFTGTTALGESAEKATRLSVFDPNTVDSVTLVQFGIKPWKVRNFLRYRAAGKVFRSVEEVGCTYGWTDEDVEMLAPYVRIDDRFMARERLGVSASRAVLNTSNATFVKRRYTDDSSQGVGTDDSIISVLKNGALLTGTKGVSYKYRSLTKVDANTADSATLCRIPGIGGGISSAIIRYRNRLGGFHSVQQLLEISIFSPELLEWFVVSDTFPLTKVQINRSSFNALNSHPYITYNQTLNLLKYIRLYGNIDDEKSLISTGIFTSEEVERLRHYIQY